MAEHQGLPVKGYAPQTDEKVALVNRFKEIEERLLREIDALVKPKATPEEVGAYDLRWLAIARTHFQEGFMALNRSVFQPQRIKLPEDE